MGKLLMGKIRRIASVLLFCVAGITVYAQKTVLKGIISVKDGGQYPYTVELEGAGSSMRGVSMTNQDGEIVRMKVNATVNKDKNLLTVTENATMGKIPDSVEACYMTALLRWKVRKGNANFSGAFVGKNKRGEMCYSGSLEMKVAAADCAFIEKEAEKKPKKELEQTEGIQPTDSLKITEGVDKVIQWEGQTCTMEVWDGGVYDGDAVTILHNGKVLMSDYVLTADKKQITVNLANGTNIFTIIAADEGTAPPTTVDIAVHDGSRHYRMTAFNKKGKEARIILTR